MSGPAQAGPDDLAELRFLPFGYSALVDPKQVGEAGLVGWRGRLSDRAADWLSRRTRFDKRTLAAAFGAYLFLSRTRRMLQMIRRLRRTA
jgi:hypothetical protein